MSHPEGPWGHRAGGGGSGEGYDLAEGGGGDGNVGERLEELLHWLPQLKGGRLTRVPRRGEGPPGAALGIGRTSESQMKIETKRGFE